MTSFEEPTSCIESIEMMKEVIRVSIYQICYLRSLFPEGAFCEQIYADMKVKYLASKKESTDNAVKDALALRLWVEEGAFVALEKEYLEKIDFCIYGVRENLKPDKLLERYTFKLSSIRNGVMMTTNFTERSFDTSNPYTVKSQAIALIRSLISITNVLQALPNNRVLTMKLQYNGEYNHSCPPNWQPKYFKQSTLDLRGDFEKPSLTLDVGQIVSQFHTMSMKLEAPEEVFNVVEKALTQESLNEEIVDAGISSVSGDVTPSTALHDERAAAPESTQENTSTSQLTSESGPRSQSVIELASMKEGIMKYCTQFESVELNKIQEHFGIDKHILSKLLDEWSAEKVFHRKSTVPDTYLVGAYQGVYYWKAIKFIHGNLRRSISASTLSKHLHCSVFFAKSILLRMEHENLIDMSVPPSYNGYPVRYDEATCQVIQNATQKINAPRKMGNSTPTTSNITHVSSSREPIIQASQTSKKRRLSVKAA
ncbi:HORMA domain-containing protein 2 [Thraustotheca clavata]|uniref:HORMA domain-containing protein 2 n=1 Tax=Thraustotheca clavata TaxID=74557 RepID=A0A1W0A1L6_9STRA|nr:HORMA domain-containing protein 2 [Thraustotheca clavata]